MKARKAAGNKYGCRVIGRDRFGRLTGYVRKCIRKDLRRRKDRRIRGEWHGEAVRVFLNLTKPKEYKHRRPWQKPRFGRKIWSNQ
jgi:hypothetical protein